MILCWKIWCCLRNFSCIMSVATTSRSVNPFRSFHGYVWCFFFFPLFFSFLFFSMNLVKISCDREPRHQNYRGTCSVYLLLDGLWPMVSGSFVQHPMPSCFHIRHDLIKKRKKKKGCPTACSSMTQNLDWRALFAMTQDAQHGMLHINLAGNGEPT